MGDDIFSISVSSIQAATEADQRGDRPLALALFRSSLSSLDHAREFVTLADRASLDALYRQFSSRVHELEASLGVHAHSHQPQHAAMPSGLGMPYNQQQNYNNSYSPQQNSHNPYDVYNQQYQAPHPMQNPQQPPYYPQISSMNNPFASAVPPQPQQQPYVQSPFYQPSHPYYPGSPVPPPSSAYGEASHPQRQHDSDPGSRYNFASGGYDSPVLPPHQASAPPLPAVPEPDVPRQPYFTVVKSEPTASTRSASLPALFPSVPSSSPAPNDSTSSASTTVSVSDVRLPQSLTELPPRGGREAWQPPVWQGDESTPRCTLCGETFTLIFRRHHCRACGRVVCGLCSAKSMPIPNMNFDTPVRVCDSCAKALGEFAAAPGQSQKAAAEITLGISSKVKAVSSYMAFMNAVKMQTDGVSESSLDYLALHSKFNKTELRLLVGTYAQFLETQHGQPVDSFSNTITAQMFVVGLNLLAVTDTERWLKSEARPIFTSGTTLPLWTWLWRVCDKITNAGELAVEGYVKLCDMLLPLSSASLEFSFDALPVGSATVDPTRDFVETKALVDALEIALRQLVFLGIDAAVVRRYHQRASAFLQKSVPVGILRETYKQGIFSRDLLLAAHGLPESRSDPFELLQTKKRGAMIPLFQAGFGLALDIALGLSLTMDRVVSRSSAGLEQLQFDLPKTIQMQADAASLPLQVGAHFTSYYADVFERVRSHFGISAEEYRASLGIEQVLLKMLFLGHLALYQQIGSAGKSGSVFFFSDDSKFLIKTISEAEFRSLQAMVPRYYQHLSGGPSVLVPIIGLHRIIEGPNQPEMYLIVMANLFASDPRPDVLYDLKGSEVGRSTPESERKPGVPLKDLDLARAVTFAKGDLDRLLFALKRDALFLQVHGTMDYSLLLGLNSSALPGPASKVGTTVTLARTGETARLGIIDYLVPWGLTKKLENSIKGLTQDKEKLSAVPPEEYSKRFIAFFEKSFTAA